MKTLLGSNQLLMSALAQRKASKNPLQAGFTLVELLVVVIIVGILAAVALPSFRNQADKARVASAKALASAAAKECQVFLVEAAGTFTQTTKGGSGIDINTPLCPGTFTATITSPAGTYSAAVSAAGVITKTCTGLNCTGDAW